MTSLVRGRSHVPWLPRVGLFARLATHRERQDSETLLGDRGGTLDTEPVSARVDPDERVIDAGETDLPLRVGLIPASALSSHQP